jgi:hypothetical protein
MTDWMTRLGWNRLYLYEYQTEWVCLIYGSARGYRQWQNRQWKA